MKLMADPDPARTTFPFNLRKGSPPAFSNALGMRFVTLPWKGPQMEREGPPPTDASFQAFAILSV